MEWNTLIKNANTEQVHLRIINLMFSSRLKIHPESLILTPGFLPRSQVPIEHRYLLRLGHLLAQELIFNRLSLNFNQL